MTPLEPQSWRERWGDRLWRFFRLTACLERIGWCDSGLLHAVDRGVPGRVEAWLRRGVKPSASVSGLLLSMTLLRANSLESGRKPQQEPVARLQLEALIQAGCRLNDLEMLPILMADGSMDLLLKVLPCANLTDAVAGSVFVRLVETLAFQPLHPTAGGPVEAALNHRTGVLNRYLDLTTVDVFSAPEESPSCLFQTGLSGLSGLSPWCAACCYAPSGVLERLLALAPRPPTTQECVGLVGRLHPHDLPDPAFFGQLEAGGVVWEDLRMPGQVWGGGAAGVMDSIGIPRLRKNAPLLMERIDRARAMTQRNHLDAVVMAATLAGGEISPSPSGWRL